MAIDREEIATSEEDCEQLLLVIRSERKLQRLKGGIDRSFRS